MVDYLNVVRMVKQIKSMVSVFFFIRMLHTYCFGKMRKRYIAGLFCFKVVREGRCGRGACQRFFATDNENLTVQ